MGVTPVTADPAAGTAAFFASRGFVSFNIDYRLAGDRGLLPKSLLRPGVAVVGAASRSTDWWPHPERGGGVGPKRNTLLHFGEGGGLCIAAEGSAVVLETCGGANASRQQWTMKWDIAPQSIVHAATARCLDAAGGIGRPLALAPCRAEAQSQQWQLGLSGRLFSGNVTAVPDTVVRRRLSWEPKWASACWSRRRCPPRGHG